MFFEKYKQTKNGKIYFIKINIHSLNTSKYVMCSCFMWWVQILLNNFKDIFLKFIAILIHYKVFDVTIAYSSAHFLLNLYRSLFLYQTSFPLRQNR